MSPHNSGPAAVTPVLLTLVLAACHTTKCDLKGINYKVNFP